MRGAGRLVCEVSVGSARYSDVILNPDATHEFHPANNLWGGAASLTRVFSTTQSAYFTVSRGYKAGGFNLSEALLPSQIQFNPESDVSFELGYKAELLDRSLRINTDVFYMRRKSLQVKTSEQLDPSRSGHVHSIHR